MLLVCVGVGAAVVGLVVVCVNWDAGIGGMGVNDFCCRSSSSYSAIAYFIS